jgi:3-hydroxymyristoyl/3-hydroxydecanoyl-(acyl carrier protein) dehydratase
MLPMAEFDDPEAVRRRFAQLCSGRRFVSGDVDDHLAMLVPKPVARTPGQTLHVRLEVPRTASFFEDHFPRRPVVPATLLVDLEARLAVELVAEAAGFPARLVCVRHVKVRAFTPPGSVLDIEARVQALERGRASVAVRARAGERTVATARVEVDVGV